VSNIKRENEMGGDNEKENPYNKKMTFKVAE